MKIDLDIVKRDLMTPLHTLYIDNFPMYSEKILTFRKKPGCSKCISDISSILSLEHSKWKFSKIYGVSQSEIEIDETSSPVKSMTWEQIVEVHKIKRDAYEQWVIELYKIKSSPLPQPQIKSFNTFYEPISDRVIVTLVLLSPTMT